jgi:hypothetical protein
MLLTYMSSCSCALDVAPSPDSASVVVAESNDLLSRAKIIYGYYKGGKDKSPRPLRVVQISRNRASLLVAGPVTGLDLRYAAVWYDVYAAHHAGKKICVHMTLIWSSGTFSQDYPPATF